MHTVYFNRYLKVAPFTLSLWRAVEAQEIADAYKTVTKQQKSKLLSFKRPVLDIGCGFGETGEIIFDAPVEMGIDINKSDLIKAQKGTKYKKVLFTDARQLPFKNNSYVTAVSVSVLEHIPQTEKAIKEAYRVLKKGGMLIFTVPTSEINQYLVYPAVFNALGLKKIARWYIKQFHAIFKHVNIYSPEKWESIVKEAGFKNIRISGTTSKTVVQAFDLLLFTSFPSQLLRWIFGRRFIIATPLRAKLFGWLFNIVTKNNTKTLSNILIIAQKA